MEIECCNFFHVKGYNIETESTIWPTLGSSRPIKLHIFCMLAIKWEYNGIC